jgi:hypothetical protein
MEVLDKGVYPKPQDLEKAQREFKSHRSEGLFNPIVGGVPMFNPEGEQQGDVPSSDPTQEVGRPVGSSGIPQESSAENLYSRKSIQDSIYATEDFRKFDQAAMRKKINKKKLSKKETELADELCQSIAIAKERKEWNNVLKECVENNDIIADLGALEGVQEIAANHGLDLYSAALLYHSEKGV